MPITEPDVRFRAALRRTDFADGGGVMTSTVIVDGLDNNLFDDITDLERLNGKLSLRKVFGAALNADNDTYLSAHTILEDQPSDPATAAFVMVGATLGEERAAALVRLRDITVTDLAIIGTNGTSTLGDPILANVLTGPTAARIGSEVLVQRQATPQLRVLRRITAVTGAGPYQVTFNESLPWAGLTNVMGVPAIGGNARIFSSFVVPTALSSGVASIGPGLPIHVNVAPYQVGGSTTVTGFGLVTGFTDGAPVSPTPSLFWTGHYPGIVSGDAVLIHSTQSMAPATVANLDVVNTGRTNLSRLRVIGNSGVVHASFVANQPAPSGVGCTANLAAGTVTFSDVSGMSQPVTVEHRIEELAASSSLDLLTGTLNLTRGISRAYPSGTKVSPLLMLGDLQGRTQLGFAQLAWTGVWSDTRIGGEPAADFNLAGYPITTTNKGSVNERWYILFTSTTAFKLIGESLGEVGTGGTGADFSPINPATGSPYVTIPYLGWSAGWTPGNLYRFNTAGANAPLWVGRSVAPSVPAGDDKVTLQLRGYVNV
jgi:hypothetical protein